MVLINDLAVCDENLAVVKQRGSVVGTSREDSVVVNLFRLNPVTGQRQFWRRLMPSDPAGVRLIEDIYIAPDAQAYGYSYYRLLSEVYIAEGLH